MISIGIAAAVVILQAIVVAAAVAGTMYHHNVISDSDGPVGGAACGKQTIAVDNTSGSPTVLYSNAAWLARLDNNLVTAGSNSLAAAFRWRRRSAAVLRFVKWQLHTVLHVVSQPGR